MSKEQKVKRAIAFYKVDRVTLVVMPFEFGERTFKVELPDIKETSLDWSHNGDVIINVRGVVKIHHPPNINGQSIKFQLLNIVKAKFAKKRIHISIFSGLGVKSIPMKNQINESEEDHKLTKKALEVYKFLRKGTIKYEYDLTGPNLSYGRRKSSVMVRYELPPSEDINVEVHQPLKKPVITFKGGVKYNVAEGERFDEDDLNPEELIELVSIRFVKYSIILIDLNYGDFKTQELDYEGPDDDEF